MVSRPSEFVAVTRKVENAVTVEKAVLSMVVRVAWAGGVVAGVGNGVVGVGLRIVGVTEGEAGLPTHEVETDPGTVTVKGEVRVWVLKVVRVVPSNRKKRQRSCGRKK